MIHAPSLISRRSWLLGTLAGWAVGPTLARGDGPFDAIRARARAAGMGPFDESESANYRAIGDARKEFREGALEVCESVAADYRKHFAERGFDLDVPKGKLTVVVLAGPKSYAAFEAGFLDEAIGGHFDLKENRLVMFDFRGIGANPKAVAEEDNTFALVHESVHQLTFNTGLLDLKANAPLCVVEGLATYAETWRPRRRGAIGQVNRRRLLGLRQGRDQGVGWIPLEALLADDRPFDDPKTEQVAYAEGWMFVHKMMEPARRAKFRAYLKALLVKAEPARRVEIASAHLGDLDRLDREVRAVR